MSVLCMLAWFGAAVSLWFGAQGFRGYRWLAGAALLWCIGLIAQQIDGVTGLSFADLPSLLAVAAAGVGIALLNPNRDAEDRSPWLPGLAAGYVMAVAVLVLGWGAIFGARCYHSGPWPGTFLLRRIHPLPGRAVLGRG